MPANPRESFRLEAACFDGRTDWQGMSPVMIQRNIVEAIAMCLAVVPASCDSPEDANKANFTKALDEHLSKAGLFNAMRQ